MVDSSVLLAIIFDEAHAAWAVDAPDTAQAQTAARARLRYPLNLGDCFAYALAVAESCPVLTLDRDFRAVDVPVVLPG